MPIRNITGSISDEERQQTFNRMNPSEYEEGFEPSSDTSGGDGASTGDTSSSGTDDFDSMSSDIFGNSSSLFDENSSGGQADGNGANAWGGANLNGTFGQAAQQQQAKPDSMDKAMEAGAEGLVALGHIVMDLFKSAGSRSLDDWALLGDRCLKIGVVIAVLGVISWVVGIFSGLGMLKFIKLPSTFIMWGGLTLACGLACLAAMTLLKTKNGDFSTESTIDDIPNAVDTFEDTAESFSSDEMDSLDDDIDSLLDDILNSQDEDLGDTASNSSSGIEQAPIQAVDTEEVINSLSEVPMLGRKFLVDNLMGFFPQNTPNFAKMESVEVNSDEWLSISTYLLSAIASACNKPEDDIRLTVKKIESTMFCYRITFIRHISFKKTNPEVLQAEIANYFKSDEDDNTVTAQLKVVGGDYICILSKGESAVITMGDCFQSKEVKDFYLNEKNRLPFILGVDELGKVWMEDAGIFPSIMIAGIARSGKSWYVNSFLLSLAAFNTPETVQFLVIDPKGSFLFKAIGFLPHTCGVHTHENVLGILDDILNKEAPRRKQILLDHRCDTIWELRKKTNIQLPFLYIVIDEVMTVIKSLSQDGRDKEFANVLIQIITQLPSLGIGILIVPHRAQGVVDKTTRSQMQFRAAVRATDDVIKETLDIPKWDRPLTKPGDIALTSSNMRKAIYVRGTGVTLSDEDNIVLISQLSRAYYKMGVEIPDMTTIGCGYNRDMGNIKRELQLTVTPKTQFSIDSAVE